MFSALKQQWLVLHHSAWLHSALYFSVPLWLCTAGAFHTDRGKEKEIRWKLCLLHTTLLHTNQNYESTLMLEGSDLKWSALMLCFIMKCSLFFLPNTLFLIVLSFIFAIFVVSDAFLPQRLFTAGRLCNDACCHVKCLRWQTVIAHTVARQKHRNSFIMQGRQTLMIWLTLLCLSYGWLFLWR